jgi:hypothetical protein
MTPKKAITHSLFPESQKRLFGPDIFEAWGSWWGDRDIAHSARLPLKTAPPFKIQLYYIYKPVKNEVMSKHDSGIFL